LIYILTCLDLSHLENTKPRIDRGVTLEERRHQREYFILCSALGTVFDFSLLISCGNHRARGFRAEQFALVPERFAPRS
jgi:hypothetical protein